MLMIAGTVTGKVVGKCFLNWNLDIFIMKIASKKPQKPQIHDPRILGCLMTPES
jgi:hypothetical protein